MIAALGASFVAAAVVSWLGVWRALVFARSRALLDHPNVRSAHTVPTPRGGGLGIVGSMAVCLAVTAMLREDVAIAAPLLPLVLASALGLADDRRALGAGSKMFFLIGVAVTALPFATVRTVPVPYLGTLDLGWLAAPLSVLWLSGYANAFNFMDGINGMAGLTAAVSGLGFAAAGWLAGDSPTAFLGVITAGAAVGFLPWNFPKARIFLGDSGSLPLGLTLAVLAAMAARPGPAGGAPALPFPAGVLLLGPFIFDTAFTLVRRAIEGKRLAHAHNEHLYQRLARGLGAHAPVSLAWAVLAALTTALALLYSRWSELGRLVSLVSPPLGMLIAVPWVFAREKRALRQLGPTDGQ